MMQTLPEPVPEMVGGSLAMQAVFDTVRAVAGKDITVLIEGESGTGKELVARALHRLSPRRESPFVVINCAALSDGLLESELFGFVKGAFTGAHATHAGLLESADQGTVFLDEVSEMSLGAQQRLLRVLQEGEVRRLGETRSVRVDLRFVAATNRSLVRAVQEGRFRRDLYYRLDVVDVRMPALAERGDDVRLIAEHLLAKHARRLGCSVHGLAPQVAEVFATYAWPGNVRELENVIQHAVVLAKSDELRVEDLPEKLRSQPEAALGEPHSEVAEGDDTLPFGEAKRRMLVAFEQRYFAGLLMRCHGNISQAARLAGIDRTNFRRKLREHRPASQS